MELSVEYLVNGIRKINLRGRMDMVGLEKIDLILTALTAAVGARVIIDLTRVTYLASEGIGVLLRCTKAVRVRGGEAVLLAAGPAVTGALAATHLDKVVKTFSELETACHALDMPLRT